MAKCKKNNANLPQSHFDECFCSCDPIFYIACFSLEDLPHEIWHGVHALTQWESLHNSDKALLGPSSTLRVIILKDGWNLTVWSRLKSVNCGTNSPQMLSNRMKSKNITGFVCVYNLAAIIISGWSVFLTWTCVIREIISTISVRQTRCESKPHWKQKCSCRNPSKMFLFKWLVIFVYWLFASFCSERRKHFIGWRWPLARWE